MTGIAIFGAGRIAKVHAQSVADIGANLVAVYDIVPEAAQTLAAQYGAKAAGSPNEAISHPDVDAVIIAASSDVHVELCLEVVKAGKRVMCEKPLAPSLKEAHACVTQLGDKAGDVFLAFNRRFDHGHARLESGVRSGDIGNLEQLIITSRDPYPPPMDYIPKSGGLFRDMMVHDFDMARWLLAEEPMRLFAQGACVVDPQIGKMGDIDSAVVTMSTPSGKQAVITNSRRATYGYDQRIEAFGSRGMIISDNQPATGVKTFTGAAYAACEPIPEFFMDRYAASYRKEIERFIDCVRSGQNAPVSALDGLHAAYLAEAAMASLKSGQPVELDENCDATWT